MEALGCLFFVYNGHCYNACMLDVHIRLVGVAADGTIIQIEKFSDEAVTLVTP
jgi:hypothetical protein